MTDLDLSRLFADLAAIAPKVNNETDGASLVVSRVERFLQDHALGVPGEVRTEFIFRAPGVSVTTYLAFERHGGRFRIVVKTVRDTFDVTKQEGNPARSRHEGSEVLEAIPWNDAPREVKLTTYPSLPALLAEVHSRAQALAASAQESTAKIDALLASVEGAPKAQPTRDPNFKFEIGQAVSTVRKMNFGLLDLCCAGRVVERDLRGAAGVIAHYRVGVARQHWHPEEEVFRGDGASAEANRVNNERGRRARAAASAPAELANVFDEIVNGTSLRTPAFNAAVEATRELKSASKNPGLAVGLGPKALHAVELVDAVLAEDETKKAEAERKGLKTVMESVGLEAPKASELSDFRRRLAVAAADYRTLVLGEARTQR